MKYILSLNCLLFLWLSGFGTVTADSLRVTTTDGVELYVAVRGEGIPCVYMHGGLGAGSYWIEVFAGKILKSRFRMIYFDQRDSGRSQNATNGDYSLDRMMLDFEEIREHLGIHEWLTSGHSFVGILQMEYVDRFPERVMGMIMVAPTLHLTESLEGMIRFALQVLEIDETESYLNPEHYPLNRIVTLADMMREQEIFWKFHYADPANYDLMDRVMSVVENPTYQFSGLTFGISEY